MATLDAAVLSSCRESLIRLQDLLAESVSAVVGVRGDALEQIRQTYAASGPVKNITGAVGVLVALLSATAFSRALQSVCERCWALPRAGVRLAAWRWLLWLLVWLAVFLVQAPLREGFGAGVISGLVLSLLSAVLLWWWTQHVLLGGRIGWLPLLPGAVLTGTGPAPAMDRSLAQFGPLGPVFTLLSWLITVFVVAVAGLAVGRMVAASRWYARLTGGRPPEQKSPATGDASQGSTGVSCAGRTARTEGEHEMTENRPTARDDTAAAQTRRPGGR